MYDPDKELFENYARHYESMGVIERLPADMQKLKRDRLPRWIDTIPRNARILDAGCGQGHLLAALLRVDFEDLTGVDLSSSQLRVARQLLSPSVVLRQVAIQDFLRETADSSFDLIFFNDILEHLPRDHIIEVLRHFHRVLAPSGRISLRVPNSAILIGAYVQTIDFTHITHFTEFSILQVLETAGFEVQRIAFDQQAPRLFWSWSKPHRALFRLLNRCRWHINNTVHGVVYTLIDMRPRPRVFDANLVVTARK